MPNAKLGAKVDRYSFFVRLLPPLLHTGLARRTNIAMTLMNLNRHSFASRGYVSRGIPPASRRTVPQNISVSAM